MNLIQVAYWTSLLDPIESNEAAGYDFYVSSGDDLSEEKCSLVLSPEIRLMRKCNTFRMVLVTTGCDNRKTEVHEAMRMVTTTDYYRSPSAEHPRQNQK